jgi:hypothetical protein
MKARLLLMSVLLVGCSNSYTSGTAFDGNLIFDGPEFEWVNPPVFQSNLRICRTLEYCRAETLFDK